MRQRGAIRVFRTETCKVWNDEVPNLQSDDPRYEYYSYPLIVANIEVWGGYTL